MPGRGNSQLHHAGEPFCIDDRTVARCEQRQEKLDKRAASKMTKPKTPQKVWQYLHVRQLMQVRQCVYRELSCPRGAEPVRWWILNARRRRAWLQNPTHPALRVLWAQTSGAAWLVILSLFKVPLPVGWVKAGEFVS